MCAFMNNSAVTTHIQLHQLECYTYKELKDYIVIKAYILYF